MSARPRGAIEHLVRAVWLAPEPLHHVAMITYHDCAQRDHYLILDAAGYAADAFRRQPQFEVKPAGGDAP